MANNLISFSLWGHDPKYVNGVKRNIEEAEYLYPNWKLRFYVQDVPQETLDLIDSYGSSHYIEVEPYINPYTYMAFMRFLPLAEKQFDHVIIRDVDSVVNTREVAAVNEWIESGKRFHVMRDEGGHFFPIMAGMWGGKGGELPQLSKSIERWGYINRYDYKLSDQMFLAKLVWPYIHEDCLVHDEVHKLNPFPPHEPMKYGRFVGDIING